MKIAVMIVIAFNVYGDDAASTAVSVDSGSSVDGITSGNNAVNSDTTASPMASAVPVKAQPSRRNRFATRPPANATTAAIVRITDTVSPRNAWAQAEEGDRQYRGDGTHPGGQPVGADPQVTGGAQRQEDRAVRREDREEGDTAEQRERVEEVAEAADELVVRVQRHPPHDVAEGNSPEHRREHRADDDQQVHPVAPLRLVPLAAVLQRDAAHDQRRPGSRTAAGRTR